LSASDIFVVKYLCSGPVCYGLGTGNLFGHKLRPCFLNLKGIYSAPVTLQKTVIRCDQHLHRQVNAS
jgi:hypothetical protein